MALGIVLRLPPYDRRGSYSLQLSSKGRVQLDHETLYESTTRRTNRFSSCRLSRCLHRIGPLSSASVADLERLQHRVHRAVAVTCSPAKCSHSGLGTYPGETFACRLRPWTRWSWLPKMMCSPLVGMILIGRVLTIPPSRDNSSNYVQENFSSQILVIRRKSCTGTKRAERKEREDGRLERRRLLTMGYSQTDRWDSSL